MGFVEDFIPHCSPSLYDEVIAGLRQVPRSIPCKYFYDERGSQIFNQICGLEEYYPTRTEIEITKDYAPNIADYIGEEACLVELGAGDGIKTRHIVSHLDRPAVYVPVDISPTALQRCARRFSEDFPDIEVQPICADYTGDWSLPSFEVPGRTVFYYPGSTLGNFSHQAAGSFLKTLAALAGADGGLLIGIDLHKDRAILEAAYNDSLGITADFNLNLLRRINRECNADFDLSLFRHHAVYDEDHQRIEMRLVSTSEQVVLIGDESFAFDEGEIIITEHSHKYTIEGFARLAESADWLVRALWTDKDQLFSLWYLESNSANTINLHGNGIALLPDGE
ncbi:MAG: L-histidine N(alpha)-methyltransferase [Bradymonadaceae bacterium]